METKFSAAADQCKEGLSNMYKMLISKSGAVLYTNADTAFNH